MFQFNDNAHRVFIRSLFLMNNGVTREEQILGIRYLIQLSNTDFEDSDSLTPVDVNKKLIEMIDKYHFKTGDGIDSLTEVREAAYRILHMEEARVEDVLYCLRSKTLRKLPDDVLKIADAALQKECCSSPAAKTELKIFINENVADGYYSQEDILNECFAYRAYSRICLDYLHQFFKPDGEDVPDHFGYLSTKIFEESLKKYFSSQEAFAELLRAALLYASPEARAEIFDRFIKEQKMKEERTEKHRQQEQESLKKLSKMLDEKE